jgi:hypothetical protein
VGGMDPDGRAFLYVKSINGVSNVWQRNLDGSESRQLTRFDSEGIHDVEFSRDGKNGSLISKLSGFHLFSTGAGLLANPYGLLEATVQCG